VQPEPLELLRDALLPPVETAGIARQI
jgi:hypothetical protein